MIDDHTERAGGNGGNAPAGERTIEDAAVFAAEQAHLTETYDTLLAMEAKLEALMGKTRAEAEHDKRTMADELTTNFASEGEAQETYIEFSGMNRVIEGYNQLQASTLDQLRRIDLLKRQPYFAKVVLQYKPGAAPRELYIGNTGISDESYKRMVVDWRSPVAEVYYNQSNGHTSYVANGRTIEVDLKLRRQFDIVGNRLNACFDTTTPIQDTMLLAALTRQRTAKMQAITTTIQKEQNEVIRHEDVPALLVAGVAGSGKTSVLMQRIAYLFYQQRETLDARQVFLITPNPVFRGYIDGVLPDMGESNPHILTWAEFADVLVPPGREFSHEPVSIELLERIDAAVEGLEFQDKDFRDITSKGVKLIGAQQIARTMRKFKNLPAGPRRVTLVREELEQRLVSRLGQMSGEEKWQDEVLRLTYNQQIDLFGELAIMEDEKLAREFTLKLLYSRHADAFEAVRRDWWLRVDRIGKRLLGEEDLPFLAWAYLKIRCSGLGNEDARYVMIDEVQDYSVAQLAIMARYFSRAHFLLLGDENQAIAPGTATFDEVRQVFEHARGGIAECRLLTSYRSTPAICELFACLADLPDDARISSVQRDDVAPAIEVYEAGDAYRDALRAAVAQAADDEGTTAVIALDDEQAQRAWDIVAGKGSSAEAAPGFLRIREGVALPAAGTVLIPLPLAKGLEFDHVIIADASAKAFPATDLARRQLYTAISRATATVRILAEDELTPLLS